MKQPEYKTRLRVKAWRENISKILLFLLFISIIIVVLGKSFTASLFWQKRDRVNLVFYGDTVKIYSFGLKDGVNYLISFFPDLQLRVPGGYGWYRAGALGKLVQLEKKQDILKKTFSLALSTMIDLYFIPVKNQIYYGRSINSLPFPGFGEIIINHSNANLFDRLFVYFKFTSASKRGFQKLTNLPILKEKISDKEDYKEIFLDDEFNKTYQGYFYQKTYRNEKANVQILYTKSYNTALKISEIIEGEGIRVVDLTEDNQTRDKFCQIVENKTKHSSTAQTLARFFGCRLISGKTEVSDIIFQLGEKEREWEVNSLL